MFKLTRRRRKRLKFIFWVFFYFTVFLSSVWLVLQTSFVQNYLIDKATVWITEKTGHSVEINRIRIRWFDEVSIRGFLLKDYKDSTLVDAKLLQVDYDLIRLIQTKELSLEEIYLENGSFNLINYADTADTNLNVFLERVRALTFDSTAVDTTEAKPLFLRRIMVENFRFSMHDRTKPRAPSGPDFSQIDLLIKLSEVENISLKPDSISLHLVHFMGADPRNGLHVSELGMKVGFTDSLLILDDLRVRTPYSSFGDSLALSYPSASALSSFADSVSFFVRVRDAKLGVQDFRFLAGSDALKDDVLLNVTLSGMLDDIRLRGLSVESGRSFMNGDASLHGLPDIEETFVDLNIRQSGFYSQDLKKYGGNDQPMLDQLERLDVVMTFAGFLNDFSTKATVNTALGGVYADMNVTMPKDKEQTSYTGHLEFRKLDVGRLIGDTALLQKVNLKGRLIGKGISRETATFITDFSATDVGVKGYDYDSLAFKGFLATSHFYGHFSIDDPNCKISGRTNVDLRKSPEKLSLNAQIDTLFTRRLKLTEQDMFLRTKINWQQKHLNPDSIDGTLKVTDTFFQLDSVKKISLAKIDVNTHLTEEGRKLHMEIPGVILDLDGKYTFDGLVKFVAKETSDVMGYFQLADYHKEPPAEVLDAKLKVTFGDLKPYMDFAAPELFISMGATLEVGMEQRAQSDAIFSIYWHSDSIVYDKAVFYENVADIYTSVSPDSGDILASILITSEKQKWDAVPHSEKFQLEGVWLNNTLDFNLFVSQPDTGTKVKLANRVIVSPDSIDLFFKPSELTAVGQTWTFDPANHITFSNRGLSFKSLALISGSKRASLSGLLSETENSSVNFVARNIDLLQFNSVLGYPIEGILEADVSIFKELGSPIQFEGDFNLYSFIYQDNLVGNVRGRTFYDLDKKGINAWLSVERENVKTITASGYFYPERTEQLDFDVVFDRADFKMLEVVTTGNLSKLSGTASGKMKISGAANAPLITGHCEIQDAGFKVDYLGTYYEMVGTIQFRPERIELHKFILRDFDGDIATLEGDIRHKNFDDIITNLQINAKNFSFLSTTSLDNDLFYGSAVASGDISVTGPISDLLLKVNVRTEKGTKFYIPLTDTDSYEQAEFMTFVNFSDTTRTEEEIVAAVEQSFGLTIDFDLEVTQDAYCELIFDIKTGDIIRGRGNGNLKMRLDKNGNFELFGPLTLTEGAYNFTVPNFINKEFQVVPGSTINWYGDPVAGAMDLQATYLQRASFGDYRTNDPENPTAEEEQKQPILVVLNLSGAMLTPNLDFDIRLHDSVTPTGYMTQILSEIRADEQKLKQQAVSLMFFKRFSPSGQSIVSAGGNSGSIGSSVSEFLTNQISYLAGQLDENLEVEVDISDMDQEGFETFQLRLAYTFMDGRLKVSRGGDFMSATTQTTNVSDIIGDWSVEYMLTKDGKLRAKMFSQSNQNIIATSTQGNMETGLSLKYVTSFNAFKDLLTRTRNEAIQRKEEEAEQNAEETPDKASRDDFGGIE